jgi:hypothetical protein
MRRASPQEARRDGSATRILAITRMMSLANRLQAAAGLTHSTCVHLSVQLLILHIIIDASMMGGLTEFLFIYLLGGITFLPLLTVAVLVHAYVTFPIHEDTAYRESDELPIVQPGDDVDAIKRAQKTLGDKFQPRNNEADVAAGYFSIFREFNPSGVNSKPLERNTPVGTTTISAPSPSVYQSMYRSIFDRKPSTSPLDDKGVGKPQKKAGNVFYVVLRYVFGRLRMLFGSK